MIHKYVLECIAKILSKLYLRKTGWVYIQILTFSHIKKASLNTLFKKRKSAFWGGSTGLNLWKSLAKEAEEKFKKDLVIFLEVVSNFTIATFGCYKQVF